MGMEGRKEGRREEGSRGMNKCMYYKHASEHACKRQERKEGGREEAVRPPSLSLFNVDFKSQIATHERESCVLKHERHVPACRNEGEGERERKRE